jgi:carbonic anhydrase
MSGYGTLIDGFKVFKATTFQEQKDVVGHLIQLGEKPSTLFITCSDMRVSPDIIFSSKPGDFFIYRNVGALVPKFGSDGVNGIIAALEYAVEGLKVDTIIVLGHARCDSMKLLMDSDSCEAAAKVKEAKSINDWLSIAEEAKQLVNESLSDKPQEEKESACEKESVVLSLNNLLTYPFIQEKVEDDSLKIFGWHFDIRTGELLGFDPDTKFFDPIA